LDTLFVVSSCNQDFNVARMERYIAMALEANVEPVIVLTKRDLCIDDDNIDIDIDEGDDSGGDIAIDAIDDDDIDIDDDDDDSESSSMSMQWLLDFYVKEASAIAGGTVPVVCLDARGVEPADQLAPWIQPGQTVAFLGSSGVGKSTLVNALCGSIVADTGAIHTDSGQGRHTTTRRQLHFLQSSQSSSNNANTSSSGCAVLDTPGLRELQLIDASHGLTQVFGDFVDLAHQCRFNDCTHVGTPGCAIEAAVEEGSIDVDRLARWQKLVAEEALNSNDMAERKLPPTTTKNKPKPPKKKAANSNKSQRKKRK
jgi:ribosome biogenesis GTPase